MSDLCPRCLDLSTQALGQPLCARCYVDTVLEKQAGFAIGAELWPIEGLREFERAALVDG